MFGLISLYFTRSGIILRAVAASASTPAPTPAESTSAAPTPVPVSEEPKKKETVLTTLEEIAKYHFPSLFVLIPKDRKGMSKADRAKA